MFDISFVSLKQKKVRAERRAMDNLSVRTRSATRTN